MKTAIIYKIICKDENIKEMYIGSTFNLNQRINEHKRHYKYDRSKDIKLYKFIKDFDNFKFEILETFECETKRQKEQKEQEYMDKLLPTLNTQKAYITEEFKKERDKKNSKLHYAENKEQELLNRKKYQERPEIKQKIKDRRSQKINCECGISYTFGHRSRHLKSKKHTNYLLTLD